MKNKTNWKIGQQMALMMKEDNDIKKLTEKFAYI